MQRLLLLLALLLPLPAASAELDQAAVAAELAAQGDALVAAYRPEAGFDTADGFSGLYFDLFEASGMEAAIGLRDSALKARLESMFGAVIGEASRGASTAEVNIAWTTLRLALLEAGRSGGAAQAGFWSLLLQSFLILLREGFEALLVVTALVAYLRKVGAGEKVRVIGIGVAAALVASLVTAWLLTYVLRLSGAAQEAVEGVTLLIAAGVLFYVSYWLFAKREAVRWQNYIRGTIDRALSRGSLFTLGFAAFLAVFREGAETVLFYQALAAQAHGDLLPLLTGFALGALALGATYVALRTAAHRVPLGLFFGATAVLLYALAVSFAGHGVLELQEAGWVGITPLSAVPRVAWIGLFPTAESGAAQGLLLLLAGAALALLAWKREPRPAAGGAA